MSESGDSASSGWAVLENENGMLKAVIEWLADFFDENPDEKMVVFAHHRQVQERLIAAFPNCARIYGYWEANPCLRVQQECSAHMISVSGAVGLARDRDDLVSSNSNAWLRCQKPLPRTAC
jgi:hypothetical protein